MYRVKVFSGGPTYGLLILIIPEDNQKGALGKLSHTKNSQEDS
jgi:hypothetical protein